MDFHLDPGSTTPIYLQIQDQVRYAISVGTLRPGDRLPSIRRLQQELGVNRNTVHRAYTELHEQGTLVVRQGQRAVVAAPATRPAGEALDPGPVAERVLQEAESRGLDAVSLARRLARLAADHDERYPRCAFVECSQVQADDLARDTGRAFGRRVVGVDLGRLRQDRGALPPSISHVLTTPWHASETAELLVPDGPSLSEATVRLARAFHEGVRRLEGRRVGLLLRDAESVGGYVELVARLARPRGAVRTALVGEHEAALALLRSAEGLVFTTPCRPFVEHRAPPALLLQELTYEPEPEGLARLGSLLFPNPEE